MKSKTIKAAALACVVAIAAYWYWSPFLAVRQLQSAAQSRDAAAFSKHIDYPKVRASIKGQMSAMFQERLGRAGGVDGASAGASFGARLGALMVERFVDAVVRPETIMRAMQGERFAPLKRGQQGDGAASEANGGAGKNKLKWEYERQGLDKIVARAVVPDEAGEPDGGKFGLVLERSGFADWKLTEIRMIDGLTMQRQR